MPQFDHQTRDVVLRVVYDGAHLAGKTANVQQLSERVSAQRLGTVNSYADASNGTEFFDWLEFSGGYVDGHRVRCHVMSVPGQPDRIRRRKFLLEAADVVVFVTDSRAEAMRGSREYLSSVRDWFRSRRRTTPVCIVVQANQRDREDALPRGVVKRALNLPSSMSIVASSARTGEGVMRTFLLAARLAADRLRAVLTTTAIEDLPAYSYENPEALRAAILAAESGADRKGGRKSQRRVPSL